jgi:hypothetical protein
VVYGDIRGSKFSFRVSGIPKNGKFSKSAAIAGLTLAVKDRLFCGMFIAT